MPFPEFDPILVQIGPLAIRWYALAYVVGILLGWRYAVATVHNTAIWTHRPAPASADQVSDFILWATLAIIIGGRLGHVLFYTPQMIWTDPLSILQVWKGGMSFHGGLLGMIVAIVIFAWRSAVDLWRLADLVTSVAPIGLFLGRIANFINGELWGRPTNVPWGFDFCNRHILQTYGYCPQGVRHPSQLYEAALEGIVLFMILRWATHGAKLLNRRGVVAGMFGAGYAIFRMSLETVREPDPGLDGFPLGLTMGMMLSAPMLLAGLWLIWRGMREALPSALPAEAAATDK